MAVCSLPGVTDRPNVAVGPAGEQARLSAGAGGKCLAPGCVALMRSALPTERTAQGVAEDWFVLQGGRRRRVGEGSGTAATSRAGWRKRSALIAQNCLEHRGGRVVSAGSLCCLVHWGVLGQRARLAQGCRTDPSFREECFALGRQGGLRVGLACTLRMDWHWVEFLCLFKFFGRVPSLCSVLECVFAPVLAGVVAVCLIQ